MPKLLITQYCYCQKQAAIIWRYLGKQAVGGRAAATICLRPSSPFVAAKVPRAAKPTAAPANGNVALGSHGEYFPTLTAAAATVSKAAS